MTALLVPMALEVLMVRDATQAFAPTQMAMPAPSPHNARRQKLLPDPFGPDRQRPAGAYLHWSLPDALTHAVHEGSGTAPVFPAVPQRWLVLRLTGDAADGPRQVAAWMLPDVNAQPPTVIADALGQAAPPVPAPPAPGQALTVFGTGDLAWSAYYDNVQNVLSFYEDLAGVTGAVSYLVVGWYLHPALDLLSTTTDATVQDVLDDLGWSVPSGMSITGPSRPTSILCHGAAVGLGWPTASWPGDGGSLATEAGGPPDAAAIKVAIADTVAEAAATFGVTVDGARQDPTDELMLQATIAGLVSQLAQADGPAGLDTSLHAARFTSQPSADMSETIWQPAIPQPDTGDTGTTADAVRPAGRDAPSTMPGGAGLADALAASATLAGRKIPTVEPFDTGDAGSLVTADRAQPRVFAPADPVIVLNGAGRAFTHGGDTRFGPDDTLRCRLSSTTLTWMGAAGTIAPDLAQVLPTSTEAQLSALGAPADTWPLLIEVAAIDPAGAPDLGAATASQPSPDSAARAAWLADPEFAPPRFDGTLPSPVAVTGPAHPWTPMHLEWALDWAAAIDGIHAFTLGSVDFELPDQHDLPKTEPAVPIVGRSLLTASPARIAAGGAAVALALVRRAGLLDEHPLAQQLHDTVAPLAAAGGAAATLGVEGAVADQDLLSGSLEGFLATLRGQDVDPIVRPPGNTSTVTSPSTALDVIRAGLATLRRARVVDAFGQYLDLAGSSASTPADQDDVLVGVGEAIDGQPGTVTLLPRFNAPARVMLRYSDASGQHQDADTAISPLCGFVVPNPLDGSLEFFGADGTALGRLRPDAALGTVWEEDPGEPATLGRKPSAGIPNGFLGQFADGLLAADTALAASIDLAASASPPQTALAALNQLIDTTRWTVDSSGSAGDEHLALLLGHPVAVLRAGIKIDVQGVPNASTAHTTAVPVKLGTLAHLQDGLLAYFVGDDYTRAHAVDPAVGEPVTGTGDPITSTYVDLTASFPVQPGSPVGLTLLAVPATDIHATVGLLPQKAVGMRRDWVSTGLAQLAPNWRYGPLLIDRKATRIPVASDVHGSWAWHHRSAPDTWATDTIVNATPTAIIPDDRVAVEYGWISLQLAPDPNFPGIPVRVRSITKPVRDARHRIQGIGGVNGDNSPWWMSLDQAIAMAQTGRFSFYVLDGKVQIPIVVDISASGRPYLHTVSDGKIVNNLNSLPEYPAMQP